MRGGNGWESNPPRLATRPDTDFEDREAHRDLTTPTLKDNVGLPNVNWLSRSLMISHPTGNYLSPLDFYRGWYMFGVRSDLIFLRHDNNNKRLQDLFS